MSSNKQNIDFYLPSLINNHKFQQIFYHHHKLIVYDSSSSNQKGVVSPKAIQMLQRPKTSVSISNKLSNRLMQARSKASIDKFISTHKRIQQQKKKTETGYLPKKKYNRALIQKTQVSQLETILTEDQSIRRDQLTAEGISKQNCLIVQITNASAKKIELLEPEDKLMKEIVQKNHSSERKSVRVSVRQIKSIDRLQSKKSINLKNPDQNYHVPHSGSIQKSFNQKTNENTPSLRKSVTSNLKYAQKTPKSNLSSFSNCSTKPKSKKVLDKQPQINKQNCLNGESSQEKTIQSTDECLQRLFNPIYRLYGHKDLYTKPQHSLNLQDLQIPTLYRVLPKQCFFSSQTQKRRSYIDNRINHLQRKIHEQQDIIKHQDEQIHGLIHHKHQPLKDENTYDGSQVSNLGLDSQCKQDGNKVSIKLSSIKEEENHSAENLNDVDELKREQALKQEMQSLNMKTMQNQHLLENQSKYTRSKLANQTQKKSLLGSSNPNNFHLSKPTQTKKLVLTSHLRQQANLLQIQQTHLKRAQITKFLDKNYYTSVKGLYWVLINQKENAYLIKRTQTSKEQSVPQSLKYIKEFHKNRSQMVQGESTNDWAVTKNEERIFVDNEFLHQNIQMPNHIQSQLHWLYFKPCTQSSIFPAELNLPQHYITTQAPEPSINSLISLLNCLLNLNSAFIERLFEPTYNNVFSCWLNKNGTFEPIHVDGYLPYNGKLNSFLAWSEEFLWIGVLLKCCAKLFGSYNHLLKLTFDDWSQTILGRTLTRVQKPSYQEIKQWQEDQFQQKVIEYLAKHQQKHKSTIVVRQKQTQSLFLITGIKNNKIKLSHIHSQSKRLEISLFEFIIDELYELVLFPESMNSYFKSSEFESYAKGNIVTYQLKVQENKSAVTISTQLSSQQNASPNFSKTKTPSHQKRRILVYEIPHPNKRQKKSRNQMVLKYSSDAHPYTKVTTNHQGVTALQMDIPQIKRGEYKIFIECGKIKLNDYFESHSKTVTRWLKTEDSFNEKLSPRNFSNKQQHQNKKFRNVLSVVSSHGVGLKGGKSLIVNDKSQENEMIEDENFVYKQGKANVKKEDEEYL